MMTEMNAVKNRTGNGVLRRGVALLAVLLLASVLVTGVVSADTWTDANNFNESWFDTYSGSDYLIYDADSLAAFSEKVSKNSSQNDFSGKIIRLMNDIDLYGHNWSAIGTSGYSFNGTFDGQYHTIKNLTSPKECDMGLFGYTNGATIQNVTVSTMSLSIPATSTSQSAGGLVGYAMGNTRIENSTVSGGQITSIQGWSICGGIAGTLNGTSMVKNCTASDITITMNSQGQYAGGFIGQVKSDASVTQCSATDVTIISQNMLNGHGGFVGYCEGKIDNSTVTGTITNTGEVKDVGGFVGQERVNSKITDCYSNVQIQITAPTGTGDANIGGFVGTTKGSSLKNCYAVGKITASGTRDNMNIGGFLGQIRSDGNVVTTMENCVSLVESISVTPTGNVSRFIGYVKDESQSVTNAYAWNKLECTDDSQPAKGNSYNGTGVSSETFWGKQDFFSTTLGWNFATIWVMNTGNPNYQLPVLSWQKRPVAGDSSSLEPPVPPQPEPQPVISSGDGNMNNAFRVLFDTQGGSYVSPATGLSYGDKITAPTNPVRDGYTFGGWYKDAACTQGWSFSDAIDGDMTLYAKWTGGSAAQQTTTETAAPTAQPTTKQTSAPAATTSQSQAASTTAVPAATTAAGVSPTLTQAPAPVFGALLGLLAAGVLLRRRE